MPFVGMHFAPFQFTSHTKIARVLEEVPVSNLFFVCSSLGPKKLTPFYRALEHRNRNGNGRKIASLNALRL